MYAKLSPPPDSRTSSQKRKSADSFRKDKKVQDLVAKAKLDKKGRKLKITILKKWYHHTVANMCDALQRWLKQTGRLHESCGDARLQLKTPAVLWASPVSVVFFFFLLFFFFYLFIFFIYFYLFIYLFFFFFFFYLFFFFLFCAFLVKHKSASCVIPFDATQAQRLRTLSGMELIPAGAVGTIGK